MDLTEATGILVDRAIWELKRMKKALSTFPILNTEEEKNRLEAVKTMLKEMR